MRSFDGSVIYEEYGEESLEFFDKFLNSGAVVSSGEFPWCTDRTILNLISVTFHLDKLKLKAIRCDIDQVSSRAYLLACISALFVCTVDPLSRHFIHIFHLNSVAANVN